MRPGTYATLIRTPNVDRLQPRPGTIAIYPETDPEQLLSVLYGAEADDVVLLGPLDPRLGALEMQRFRFVDGKAFCRPPSHSQLTPLEALLLRALYSYAWDIFGETTDTIVAELKQDGWDDADCAVLHDLLEQERADRQ